MAFLEDSGEVAVVFKDDDDVHFYDTAGTETGRCSLAAQLNVRSAKIGNRRYSSAVCDDIRVADLQREGFVCIGLMAQCLAVAADGRNGRWVCACRAEQCAGRSTKTLANLAVKIGYVVAILQGRIIARRE